MILAGRSSRGSPSQTHSGAVRTHGRGGQRGGQHRAGHGCVRIPGKSARCSTAPKTAGGGGVMVVTLEICFNEAQNDL